MQTVDNIITSQRELNSSVSSVNSSNNALRAMAHSKGKNRQTNLTDCIDIKNIVRNSVQGINGIFDNEKLSENKNNPLSLSYNSDVNSSRKNNFYKKINEKEINLNNTNTNNTNINTNNNNEDCNLNLNTNEIKSEININNLNNNINSVVNSNNSNEDLMNSLGSLGLNNNNNFLLGKNSNNKGKIITKKNYKFEPIEEENNMLTYDLTTNNISKYNYLIFNSFFFEI